jgi:tight adherence protein C
MNTLGFLIVAVVMVAAYVAARSWRLRASALRLLSRDDAGERLAQAVSIGSETRLSHWLAMAGYRHANAPTVFVAASGLFAVAGLLLSQVYRIALLPMLAGIVVSAPGGTAEMLGAVLRSGGWITFGFMSLVPFMVVRTARRTRVREVEQDLPLTLELFATMAEAGLGFDAALGNIVRTRGRGRALTTELVNFQLDMLAGVPRVLGLRQLAHRVDVPALTRLTSALIQAELVGASVAETLGHQAEDLRQRRREDALLLAQALPVKLVFPLVICFLPGIFVSTLAPVIYQMILMANSVLGSGGR